MNNETIIIIGVAIIIVFIILIALMKSKMNSLQKEENKKVSEPMPYEMVNSIFTKSEKIVFDIIKSVCEKNNLLLFAKVRLADIVKIEKGNKNFNYWFNKIRSKHLDYLICENINIKPIIAVELDDYTHNQKNRKERDIFVDEVYSKIGLPILHITQLEEKNILNQITEMLNLSIDNTATL